LTEDKRKREVNRVEEGKQLHAEVLLARVSKCLEAAYCIWSFAIDDEDFALAPSTDRPFLFVKLHDAARVHSIQIAFLAQFKLVDLLGFFLRGVA
jgi:hypothetical protein